MTLVCPGTPTDVRPSYRAGFAPRNGLPQYPRLWRGLVGLWPPYLGPTGLRLYNWSAYRQWLKGTLTNMDPATDWVMSPYGWALKFAAADDKFVQVGNPSALQIAGALSVAVWIRLDSTTTHQAFVAKGAVLAAGQNFGLGFLSPGTVYWQSKHADNTTVWIMGQAFTQTGVWTLFAGTWDGTTDAGGVVLYINGVPFTGTANRADPETDKDLRFAHTSFGGNYPLNGALGSVGIWNRALTAAEIQYLYRDAHALTRPRRLILPGAAAPPGAIMNLIQGANLGADLYNGTLAV